ncbi:YhdP family protein [Pseudothauera rhizosphaerae]|uniref:TIGR02099 family protein n=1 Tax=Pseudothauera rhizosphaerae TaxID=2565932 RepID=A0A4V3W9K5_9RHOO|nr:YhdP family protein [Pseudothauera rhizosphaerae]THF55614.1 TIGR02099 family protein [Pseudothauera rhizosphaerae]
MNAIPPSSTEPPSGPAPEAGRRRLGRRVLLGLALAWLVVGGLFLVLREVVIPRVGEYRPQIAAALERAIGLPVAIDALSADWSGLRPRFHIGGLQISERDGSAALRFERVDAVLAWSSLLRLQPHFHRLEIFAPQLALRRDAAGRLFVAGLAVDAQAPGGGALEWLLAQRQIVIRDAALNWTDGLRGAPELRLDKVDFRLERRGERYRFGLAAEPPAALASRLDLRGDLRSVRADDPAAWAGEVYLALDHAELGAWRPWIDYPVELDGGGGLRAWIGLEGGRRASLSVNLALDGVTTRLAPELPQLDLESLRGQLSLRHGPGGLSVQTRGLALRTGDGVVLAPTDADLALQGLEEGQTPEGEFRANRLEFAALARLAAHLPLGDAARARLAAFDPRGQASAVRVQWRGPIAEPQSWKVHAGFAGIGLAAQGALPGLGGLSGEIDGDERGGRFRIAGQNGWIDLPAVFAEPRLALSTLKAEGGWTRRDGRLEIAVDTASFENPDAAGSASGRYLPAADGPGEIDLSARLLRADGPAVWRYMPLVVNQDTRNWLRRSIVGGTAPDARLRLRGDLSKFPFRDGADGQFLVTARIAGARLEYAPGWPAIEGINGELRFEGAAMRVSAERGSIFGVQLSGVSAEIPNLMAHGEEVLTIRGNAAGPTADFLRFVAESPVARRTGRFTAGLRAEGDGTLDLTLTMPLHHVADTAVDGGFRFAGNRLWAVQGLPPFEAAAGTLQFTGDTLAIPQARARLFGQALTLTAATGADGTVSFRASGALGTAALRRDFDWPALAHLSGTTAWQADVALRGDGTRIVLQSALDGIASSLPEPFNKPAAERWPLRVEIDAAADGERQDIRATLAERASLALARRATPLGWAVERGGVAVNRPLASAADGVLVHARLDTLDLDAWRRVLRNGAAADDDDAPALPLAGVDLSAGQLQVFGQDFNEVELKASALGGDWQGRLASREAAGRFEWHGAGDGALLARLQHLHLAGGERGTAAEDEAEDDEPLRKLPAIDLHVDRFTLRDKELGELEVKAFNRAGEWQLERLALRNPDGELTGSGTWRTGLRPVTRLDFRLQTGNVGALLHRVGYPDAVRDGSGSLTGALDWRGTPLKVDYPSLAGALQVDVSQGQFNKLEPGVGRLLGVLSLQALPRRISLDFRDVFSEGFVFDRVSGSIAIDAGVMRTDDLTIRGPAARIAMRGSADLAAESQELRVTVQPTLSESVAIGAAAGLINPVAGVVTYIAQKALSDPIEKLFAFDYAITGNWSDPKVEKLTGRAAAPASQVN